MEDVWCAIHVYEVCSLPAKDLGNGDDPLTVVAEL